MYDQPCMCLMSDSLTATNYCVRVKDKQINCRLESLEWILLRLLPSFHSGPLMKLEYCTYPTTRIRCHENPIKKLHPNIINIIASVFRHHSNTFHPTLFHSPQFRNCFPPFPDIVTHSHLFYHSI